MNDWDKTDYLLLSTQKRDGSWVDTPVWFAPGSFEGKDCFYLFSEGKAGKVKRIRNFEDVKIQTCTVTGKPTGHFITAKAILLNAHQSDQAHAALKSHYGFKMRALNVISTIGRKIHKRAYIAITEF